jgi:Nif-specific regulatory protein
VAEINVPVLITGEPGTGKEKVAQALHIFSNMKGAFVPLNCSSIPEGIFESELFGSVKGAFHNAVDKPGKLELASDGTIFLDEVGDMHLSLQPKLLRFLEDKKLSRLGDTKVKTINVRVIAATNQNLKTMMGERKFREDFYQRLACVRLDIPPLRERKDDILPLTEFFLSKFSREHNLEAGRISDKAKTMLLDYHWPGNVRELGNILLNAIIRRRGKVIEADHLLAASEITPSPEPSPSGTFLSMQDMEKIHIKEALERTGWNKVDAAKLLGMSRDTIYKKIQKYNIT